MGGESVEGQSGASRQPMAQRVCRSCRGKIGTCFLCHQPVKGGELALIVDVILLRIYRVS